MTESKLLSEILDDAVLETDQSIYSNALFQVKLDAQVFQSLLDRVQTIVPVRDIKPVLKNVLFTATNDRLQLYSTNLEVSFIASTSEVDIALPGNLMIPYKRLSDVLRSVRGSVLLSGFSDSAKVEADRTTWELRLQSGYSYPDLPSISGLRLFEIDRELFLRGLQSVRYAVARDASRAPTSLMMVNVSNGKMTACDGGRFQQFDLGADFPVSLNISVFTLDELIKVLRSSGAEKIGIGETERNLVFQTTSGVLVMNKLTSKFPDMESTLLRPSLSNTRDLKVPRSQFISAIKRVRVNADVDTSALGLSLSLNRLIISAQDRQGNEAQEFLDVEWLGEKYHLMVNHYYLMEMLQMASNDTCSFRLGFDSHTRRAPILLQEENSIGVIPQMNSDWVGAFQR